MVYDCLRKCRDNDGFDCYVMFHTTEDAIAESTNGSVSQEPATLRFLHDMLFNAHPYPTDDAEPVT